MGYPNNPGMPVYGGNKGFFWSDIYKAYMRNQTDRYMSRVPEQINLRPKNILEILFNDNYKPVFVNKTYYVNKIDGFYAYYFQCSKAMLFLPNIISEFLQIYCQNVIGMEGLEVGRVVFYAAIQVFFNLYGVRIVMGWIIQFNPYLYIWSTVLVNMVDWIEESVGMLIPNMFGLPMQYPVFLGIVTFTQRSISNLIFTMPYLPGEQFRGYWEKRGDYYVFFKSFPYLWYKYGIPNSERLYWQSTRLDIYQYMNETYTNLNIDLLPDQFLL